MVSCSGPVQQVLYLCLLLWSTLIHHDLCSDAAEAGLKYYDLQPGNGDDIVKGKVVKVCIL